MPSPATGPLHILFPRQKRSPPLFSSNWHLFTQSISAQMITTLGKPHRLPSAPPPRPSPLFSMAASLPLLFHHSTATQPRIYLCDDQIPNHLSHCHSTDSLLLLLLSRFSRVPLCETPQAPPSLGFSRQERWSGRCRLLPKSTNSIWLPTISWASLVAQMVKTLPTMQEAWVQSLGQEDPLEKGMATQSSIFVWRIPGTEEPGGL